MHLCNTGTLGTLPQQLCFQQTATLHMQLMASLDKLPCLLSVVALLLHLTYAVVRHVRQL